MAGWASGFQAGAQLGRSLIDTYQQAREQRLIQEAQGLKPVEVPGAQYSPEEQAREAAIAQQQAMQGAQALGLTPEEAPEFVARMPVQAPTQAPSRWQLGEQTMYRAPTEQEVTRARNEAIARAIELRNPMAAAEMRRGLAREAREEETYQYNVGQRAGMEGEAATRRRGLEATVTKQERDLEREQRAEAGKTLLYARLKDNPNLTSADLGQIAAESGADVAAINQAYLNFNNVDEVTYKRGVTQRVREMKKAAVDVPTFNKYLSSKLSALDPNPNDDVYPQVVQTKNGMQVMYGNVPLPGWGTYKNFDELVAAAEFRLNEDVVGGLKLTADLRTKEAQAEENKARAGLLGAQAGRVREMPTEKGIAPEYVATLNDINVRMGEAQARGDTKEVQRLMGEYQRTQSIALSAIGKVMPLTIGVQAPPEMTKAQEDRYKELIKTDRWARLSPGQRAAELQAAGIPPAAAGIQSRGEAAEIYQQERPTPSKTAPPPSTAPAPAAAPARTREAQPNPYFNTRGERIANPPPGAPSLLESTVVPAVGLVAERVGQFATDSQRRYLQSKVAAGTASPGELIQARRLGLIQ